MPPHQFGAHRAPPCTEPLRAARLLSALHEPPRIRRRRLLRRRRWSTFAAMATIVALFAASLAAYQAMHPLPPHPNLMAGRAGR